MRIRERKVAGIRKHVQRPVGGETGCVVEGRGVVCQLQVSLCNEIPEKDNLRGERFT